MSTPPPSIPGPPSYLPSTSTSHLVEGPLHAGAHPSALRASGQNGLQGMPGVSVAGTEDFCGACDSSLQDAEELLGAIRLRQVQQQLRQEPRAQDAQAGEGEA